MELAAESREFGHAASLAIAEPRGVPISRASTAIGKESRTHRYLSSFPRVPAENKRGKEDGFDRDRKSRVDAVVSSSSRGEERKGRPWVADNVEDRDILLKADFRRAE